jgi:hypothetical protein
VHDSASTASECGPKSPKGGPCHRPAFPRKCAPEAQQAMQLSLSRLGQLTPVQAYRMGSVLEIFDGIKRARAARALSWATLRVEVHALDAPGAKVRLLRMPPMTGRSDRYRGDDTPASWRQTPTEAPPASRYFSACSVVW